MYPVASLEPPYPPPFCPVFILFSNPVGRLKSAARGCTFCFKRSSTSCSSKAKFQTALLKASSHVTRTLVLGTATANTAYYLNHLQPDACCPHSHHPPHYAPPLICCMSKHFAMLLQQQCMLKQGMNKNQQPGNCLSTNSLVYISAGHVINTYWLPTPL